MTEKGVRFPRSPVMQDYGAALAEFVDSEGAVVSVSEPAPPEAWTPREKNG